MSPVTGSVERMSIPDPHQPVAGHLRVEGQEELRQLRQPRGVEELPDEAQLREGHHDPLLAKELPLDVPAHILQELRHNLHVVLQLHVIL